MNIPSGTPLKTGLSVSSVDFFSLIKELSTRKFSGYLAIAISGKAGVEEGTMFFDDGKPVGAEYEYYFFKKSFYGKQAFERVVNASAAEHGVMDVFELSADQVHLVLAFNEAIIFVPEQSELASRSVAFSQVFEDQVASSQVPVTRASLLRKYNISGVLEKQQKPQAVLREVPMQEDLLEKLVKQEKM